MIKILLSTKILCYPIVMQTRTDFFFCFQYNNINISEYLSSFLICFKNMSFETRFKSSYVPLMTVGDWNNPLVDMPC